MNDVLDIKSDFAIYDKNPDYAYFDSASTTLVPKIAVDTTTDFLTSIIASARRGAHRLAVKGNSIVEDTRAVLADFLQTSSSQVSFQKSIPSIVASIVYGFEWNEQKRSKIVIAENEEHSVLVAMMRSAEVLGLDVDIIPMDTTGKLMIEKVSDVIDKKTGIVAVGHTAVGTGVSNPIEEIKKITLENNALLLTDITRSIGLVDDPLSLGMDIALFSANIGLMGPPGLAIQWMTCSLSENHIPGILGGSGVANVTKSSFEPALPPDKFESGTLNIPAIAGLGTALRYLKELKTRGFDTHLNKISSYVHKRLTEIEGLVVYGELSADGRTIFGFNVGENEINCHDVALFLDESDIAVRSGLLCAHPLIRPISSEGIVQVSLHGYNSLQDINRLAESLETICRDLL